MLPLPNVTMTICKDVPVRIINNDFSAWKVGKKYRYGRRIHRDWGDVPTLTFNNITKKFESVINSRGKAYAKRRDLRFRNGRGCKTLNIRTIRIRTAF